MRLQVDTGGLQRHVFGRFVHQCLKITVNLFTNPLGGTVLDLVRNFIISDSFISHYEKLKNLKNYNHLLWSADEYVKFYQPILRLFYV